MQKLIYIISVYLLAACHSRSTEETTMPKTNAAISRVETVAENLKNLKFDYTKDPACGMPLKAGLEDTANYKGKLYGFCSKECKDAFMKSPESFLAHLVTP